MCLGEKNEAGIGKQWMEIPSFYLESVGGPFIFDCDYDTYIKAGRKRQP